MSRYAKGFSLDVLQAYDVPSTDPTVLEPGYNPTRHHHAGWAAQMFHIDQRILVGGRIVSVGHVEALRMLGITHVLSVDDEGDFDRRFWLDGGSRRWVPLSRENEDWPVERLTAIGRWLEPALSRTSNKLYIHCKLGDGPGPMAGYLALRVGGMTARIARSRVVRGRVDTEDQLGRMQAGFTNGWFPPVNVRHFEAIDRLMGSWVSLLDYGVRPLASN